METTVEIEATLPALLAAMQPVMAPWGVALTPELVHVNPYGGIDERIGWNTHIVTIDGYGVYGFTDGPLNEPSNLFSSRDLQDGRPGHSRLRPELDSGASFTRVHPHFRPQERVRLRQRRRGCAQSPAGF